MIKPLPNCADVGRNVIKCTIDRTNFNVFCVPFKQKVLEFFLFAEE